MSHLARYLGATDSQLDHSLEVLHSTLGGVSHDVQLLGEILQKSAELKRLYKLDGNDTTDHELYIVLRQRVSDDNERLARAIGINHENAVSEATPIIVSLMQKQYKESLCFVPKTSRLKTVLKENPPKQVMEALHYRSIDSMLKHESAAHLVVLSRYLEDSKWQDSYKSELSSLSPHDFEERPLEIVWFDKMVLAQVFDTTKKRHNHVLHAKEAGCLGVVATSEKVINAYTIRTLSLLYHYAQEILYASSFAKTSSTQKDFGKRYTQVITNDTASNVSIASMQLPWRVVHKAIHTSGIKETFPPHLQNEEWLVLHANNVLDSHSQHINRWNDLGHVIISGNDLVSANIIDLAIDESRGTSFGAHSLKYARRDLEQELFRRYVHEPRVANVILKRLGIF